MSNLPGTPGSGNRRAGLAWAGASAVSGALFVIPWKLANEAGEAAHSVLILLSVSAMASTVWVVALRWRRPAPSGALGLADWGVAALLAGFTLGGNAASARAIQDLSPAMLNVLLRAEVILVAVLGWLWLGERVELRFWLGAVLAVCGLVVLQGPDRIASDGLGAAFAVGTPMALLAALCFSTLALLARRYIASIDPLAVNAIRLWFAVALWFPFNAGALPASWEAIPRDQWLFASLAAIAGPFVGRLCLMLSARSLEARVTTLANLSAPAITVVLAWLLLGDWPRGHELLGGAILIAGIAAPLVGRR